MHIIQSSSESLTLKAYLEQLNSTNDKFLWIQFIKNILQYLDLTHVWNNHCTFDSHALLTVLKNTLIERFVIFWKRRMLSDETMKMFCTYKVSKQNFGIESYLDDIYDKTVRKCLSSFRISAHRLRIERGRYFGETKTGKRICTTCNVVEDEIHFLCQCYKYASQKKILYDSL